MDNLIAVLGASDTYVGTDGSTHTLNNVPPLHTLKQWYENLWWCGGNIYKIAGIKPDTACIRLDPAIQ